MCKKCAEPDSKKQQYLTNIKISFSLNVCSNSFKRNCEISQHTHMYTFE